MKVTVPEISFHNRDPVLSVDVQHNSPDGITRMATGGTDTHVVIWQVSPLPSGGVSVEALSDLVRHNRAVNAVRFSPDGTLLASADDEAAIIVWRRQDNGASAAPDLFNDDGGGEERNTEHWTIHKMLRGHIEDVYDLSWSACSTYLVSGSIDNSAIMWDVNKGKNIGLLKEHKNFVQGVAWDPLGQYVATLSSDRVMRWFSIASKRVLHKAYKAALPTHAADGSVKEVTGRLFYDDTLKSFCRRLSFSPDGLLLVAPSGIIEDESQAGGTTNAVHVFTRLSPTRPAIYLPTKDKSTVAVRFCPLLFSLRPGTPDTSHHGQSVFALPYRMVFAVACQNSVVLYDTQQLLPFARMCNMHYTRLTDLAWSSDGRILAISSTDGYCSLTYFNKGELGEVYSPPNAAVATPLKVSKDSVKNDAALKSSPIVVPSRDNIVDKNAVKKDAIKTEVVSEKGKDELKATPVKYNNEIKSVTKETKTSELEKQCPPATPKQEIKNIPSIEKEIKPAAKADNKEIANSNNKTPGAVVDKPELVRKTNILIPRRAPKPTQPVAAPKPVQQTPKVEENVPFVDPGPSTSGLCFSKKLKDKSISLDETTEEDLSDEEEDLEDESETDEDEEIDDEEIEAIIKDMSDGEEVDNCEEENKGKEEEDLAVLDDSLSIGSRDSEEENDDANLSGMSFDDEDQDPKLSNKRIRSSLILEDSDIDDDEMGVSKIIDDNDDNAMELDISTGALNNNPPISDVPLPDNIKVDDKTKKALKNALFKLIKNCKPTVPAPPKVNLIAVKRKPETSRTPSSLSASKQPSKALVAGNDSISKDGLSVDCIVENTSDLCLQLEGEDTVTSPIKPASDEAPSTPVKKPKLSSFNGGDSLMAVTPSNTSGPLLLSKSVDKKDSIKGVDGFVHNSPLAPLRPSNSAPKPPRRVALVTLSSPKAKKSLASKPN